MNLRALLELCRISNLPTVWSNVFAGFAIGAVLRQSRGELYQYGLIDTMSIDWAWHLMFLPSALIGISLIYCGGMVLNDYWDRDVDKVERPSRPIPSGRIKPVHAKFLFIGLFLFGFIAAGGYATPWMTDLFVFRHFAAYLGVLLLLIACVFLYNSTHLSGQASVLAMGLCRALAFLCPVALFLPMTAGNTAVILVLISGPAWTLFLYTVLISIVARREVEPGGFGGPKTVMNMIAAMPLLDAIWLIAMGLWPASLFCVACAGMTKLAHRKVAGS